MERAFRSLSLVMPPPRRSAERIVPSETNYNPRRGGRVAGAVARRPAPIYLVFRNSREDDKMAWTTPTLVEICIGLEINGYLPAEF
jgi:coenzyme PQQ precursor peptide PqqA